MQLTSLSPQTIDDKPALDQPKMKELKQQESGEKATEIKDWAAMVGKTVPNGTIIKVDDSFKRKDRDFFRNLKRLNPTWTGEYLQMQSTEKGKIVPKAYNMAAVFRNDPKAFSQDLQGAMVFGQKQPSPDEIQSWIKQEGKDWGTPPDWSKMTPQDIDKYYSESQMPLPDRLSYVLNNNPKLAAAFMQNPKLYDAFKDELGKAVGGDIRSQFGQAQVFERALEKAYDMKTPPDPAAYDMIAAFNALKNTEFAYNKVQGDLSAKMKIAGTVALRVQTQPINSRNTNSCKRRCLQTLHPSPMQSVSNMHSLRLNLTILFLKPVFNHFRKIGHSINTTISSLVN
jgi:hypothetical protein